MGEWVSCLELALEAWVQGFWPEGTRVEELTLPPANGLAGVALDSLPWWYR